MNDVIFGKQFSIDHGPLAFALVCRILVRFSVLIDQSIPVRRFYVSHRRF